MGSKSARTGEKQIGQTQQQLANSDIAGNAPDTSAVTRFANSLLPSTSPGGPTGKTAGLSPYSAAQYGSDLENINNTYGNLRQAGFKLLGSAGFGGAPSGERSSMVNNLLTQEGQAQTGAYRTALENTLAEGQQGASDLENEQQINNPNVPLAGASNSFSDLSKMGTTASDIATGITDAASIASGFAGMGAMSPVTGTPAQMGYPGQAAAGILGSSTPPPMIGGGSAAAIVPGAAAPGGGQASPAGMSSLYTPLPTAPSISPASSTKPASSTGGFNRLAQ